MTNYNQIKRKYIEAIETAIAEGKKIKYNPTRFIAMNIENGFIETSEKLLCSDEIHDGFTTLFLKGRIELTIEYIVANNPDFHELFTPDAVQKAKNKLINLE